MRLFILLLSLNVLFSLQAKSAGLEAETRHLFLEFKTTHVRKPRISAAVAFVEDLHQKLLRSQDEREIQDYRKMLAAIIGHGTGVGGLKRPKNETDKSYLATPEEQAIMRLAIIDIERVRNSSEEFDLSQDYFSTLPEAPNEFSKEAFNRHIRSIKRTALEILSLKNSISNSRNFHELREIRAKALKNIDFFKFKTPAIHRQRITDRRATYFDAFMTGIEENKALEEVLKWEERFQPFPLIYLSTYGPDVLLAKEKVLEKLKTAESRTRFYPYWLELVSTVTDPALKKDLLYQGLISQDKLSKAEKKLVVESLKGVEFDESFYNLLIEQRILDSEEKLLPENLRNFHFSWAIEHVLEQAIAREDWPTVLKVLALSDSGKDNPNLLQSIKEHALIILFDAARQGKVDIKTVIESLEDGIRYGGDEKFYCNGLWEAYQVLLLVYGNQPEKLTKWINEFFSAIFMFDEYKVLLSRIAQDLLEKDHLDLSTIQRFSGKDWIKPGAKSAFLKKYEQLVEKSTDTVQLAELIDRDTSYENDAKSILVRRLVQLETWDDLAEACRTRGNNAIAPLIIAALRDANALTFPRLRLIASSINVEHFGEQFFTYLTSMLAAGTLSENAFKALLIQLAKSRYTTSELKTKLITELMRLIPLGSAEPLEEYNAILRASSSNINQLNSVKLLLERTAEQGNIRELAELRRTWEPKLKEQKATLTTLGGSTAEIDEFFKTYNTLMNQALKISFAEGKYNGVLEMLNQTPEYEKIVSLFTMLPLLKSAKILPPGFLVDFALSTNIESYAKLASEKLTQQAVGHEQEDDYRSALAEMTEVMELRTTEKFQKSRKQALEALQ